MKELTYADVGVDHAGPLDDFKQICREAARKTASYADYWAELFKISIRELSESRGQSAYLMNLPAGRWASVLEGVGTKIEVTAAMHALKPHGSYYYRIGQDLIAAAANDVLAQGAFPIQCEVCIACGDDAFYSQRKARREFVNGLAHACRLAHCVWGSGETQILNGVVKPGGSAVLCARVGGIVPADHPVVTKRIQEGDAIVFVESSGPHTNGYTLARAIAERKRTIWEWMREALLRRPPTRPFLPKGYLTEFRAVGIDAEGTYGHALLEPSIIYADFMAECWRRHCSINDAIHVTGHGLLKLMRSPAPFVYEIERVPDPAPVFQLIQRFGPVSPEEMYRTFNMGIGFVLVVSPGNVDAVIEAGAKAGLGVTRAGTVRRNDNSKEARVEIRPLGITYAQRIGQ